MEASRTQLRAIDERVTLAQAKIEKIKGSKKAIKVLDDCWILGRLEIFQ